MTPVDVAIVGAGPAGLFVWEVLVAAGLDVALLEAGPLAASGDFAPPSDPALWRYRTSRRNRIDWTRVHAVGGRSLRWGGYGFRFPHIVFEAGGWPYGARTLSPDYRRAEAWLGLVEGRVRPLHRRAARSIGWEASPLRGARRDGRIWTARQAAGVDAALTGHVACALVHDGACAAALRVVGPHGRDVSLKARAFVLAAGPIETARLLMATDLRQQVPRLGEGLVDHPTLSYLLAEPLPAPAPASPHDLLDGALLAEPAGQSVIEVSGPRAAGAEECAELVGFGLLPRDAAKARITYINGITQTFPSSGRRVELAPRGRDRLNRPIPLLHLGTSARDDDAVRTLRAVCKAFAEAIASPDAMLFLIEDAAPTRRLFHEAGTCAMGLAAEASCDPFGRLRALRNVWVADASVFPSAGDRHPTLTILAHASRVARDVTNYACRFACSN